MLRHLELKFVFPAADDLSQGRSLVSVHPLQTRTPSAAFPVQLAALDFRPATCRVPFVPRFQTRAAASNAAPRLLSYPSCIFELEQNTKSNEIILKIRSTGNFFRDVMTDQVVPVVW